MLFYKEMKENENEIERNTKFRLSKKLKSEKELRFHHR